MHKHFKRLGLAFAISTASLLGTLTWYFLGRPAHDAGDRRGAVARLTESTDEVQRKETSRVMWETIDLDADLYAGEAIRTGPKSSAKVKLKTGAVIQLDPDSLVVLEQNDRGLALDFLEGNMFVQGGTVAGATETITLKTAQGDIKMNQADVSLSRNTSGAVDLEVYRGQLEVNRGGQTVALGHDKAATLGTDGVREKRDQLRLTTPVAGETIMLNLSRGEKLDLAWTSLPTGYRVSVDVGHERTKLTRVNTAPFDGVTGRGAIDLKSGRWFVRLTAVGVGLPELTSLLTPFTITPRSPPILIEPTAEAPVSKRAPADPVTFRWLDRHPFESHVFELARDAGFRDKLQTENLGAEVDHFAMPVADGTYFWRVTGFSNKKSLSSDALRIRVALATDDRATLTAPLDRAQIPAADARTLGVAFKWHTPSAANVTLDVRDAGGSSVRRVESADGLARVNGLKPGDYTWSVTGSDRPSETFHFTVVETPRLVFVNPTPKYAFVTAAPSFATEWRAFPGATYRYRTAPAGTPLDQAAWVETKTNRLNVTLGQEGAIDLDVEAVGPKGEVLGSGDQRAVVIERRPLLPAPRWLGAQPRFKSDARGNVTIDWDPVAGASSYTLEIQDQTGRVTERSFARAPASLKKLRPGVYQMKVRGIDEFKRDGDVGPVRPLEVPSASDIRAPKIKAMKVK